MLLLVGASPVSSRRGLCGVQGDVPGELFPESARDARQMQFRELRQGEMTVPEYGARFTVLARFTPDLVMTEANQCKRFERGLRAEIFDRILAHRTRECSTLVDTAAAVEAGRRTGSGGRTEHESGTA